MNTTDSFFEKYDKNKETALKVQNFLTTALNNSLACPQDYNSLLSLIPYIEQGDGAILKIYSGESVRILRILRMIELECAYSKTPFSYNCPNKESLMEKYMLSLFSFRRLLFRLSPDSVREAAFYLQHNILSVFAVSVIIQDDLIIPDRSLYDQITEIYSAIWTDEEHQLFSYITEIAKQ